MRLLPALALCLVSLPAAAQDNKALQVRWFGHSYFLVVTTAGTRVAFDPHAISEYGAPQISPDVVLMSHPHNDHNRKEILANADSKNLRAFEGVLAKGRLGEWNKIDEKVKDVRVRSVGTFHDEEEGAKRGRNAAFIVEADGLVICHLGDLGHELSEEQVKAIGPVDVLMVPIGGIYTLNGEKAKQVVAQLKPRLYILPMHYGTKVYMDLPGPEEFLDGQKEVRDLVEKTNLLEIPKDFKSDRPTVVMLGWK
jgi:L-ascorbate metabolism protein UlaG (beta-lactamase superfamily)